MHWLRQLLPAGLAAPLARVVARLPFSTRWLLGRLVEIGGNHVTVAGLTFSVDNPLITTREKSQLYLGFYEEPEIALAHRHLVRGLPVIELGGGIGVVACVINRRLEHPGDHMVVEANPHLIPTLETNRKLNRCEFQIRNAALAYGDGEIELAVDSFVTSRVGATGSRVALVPTTTLAKLLEESGFARINLVADIEGAEADLLEREGTLLRDRVQTLILETHPRYTGVERTARMLDSIQALGFTEVDRFRTVYAFEKITP